MEIMECIVHCAYPVQELKYVSLGIRMRNPVSMILATYRDRAETHALRHDKDDAFHTSPQLLPMDIPKASSAR